MTGRTLRARLSPAIVLLAALVLSCAALADAAAPHKAPHHKQIAGSLAQRSNVPGLTSAQYANAFVTRRGSKLYVAGKPFRFAGANAESLGLRNYGPILSVGQKTGSEQYPTKYEIYDEFATLHELGATVVRAQTIGDTVGCALCIEPSLGHFNKRAFHAMDLAVLAARQYGIKLIGEFDGDANGTQPFGPAATGSLLGNSSTDWYCAWNDVSQSDCPTATFENPKILHDYEQHMKAVLDHVNPYTGLAYKNDPTFAGWVDGNNLWLLNPTPLPRFETWLRKVSSYYKSIDHRQLFIDISAAGADYLTPTETSGEGPALGPAPVKAVLKIPGIDLYGEEWYPKDFPALDPNSPAAKQLHINAAAVARAGKAYATIEYGWDRYNYASHKLLQGFLSGIRRDKHVSGQLFWDLVGHSSGHGWEAVPADEDCSPTCQGLVEDGSWWALYYTGVKTASNTAADMAARAQIIRAADYRFDGFERTPAHELPPPPIITSTTDGHVLFEGSAGARDYSVQKRASGRWLTPCSHCTTDADDGWQDPALSGTLGAGKPAGCYRVIAYNLSGRPSLPSSPAGVCGAIASARQVPRASRWIGSWTSPPVRPGSLSTATPMFSGTGGYTVRNIVHLTLGGPRLQIRLSNVFGSHAATFTDVTVAASAGAGALTPGTEQQLTFDGQTTVTVPAGRQVTSDPLTFATSAGENLAISLYAPSATGTATIEGSLNHTNYLGSGDQAAASSASGYGQISDSWYWLGGVSVSSTQAGAGAIVALGDSITAGYNSTQDASDDWVDLLAERLHRAASPLSVLNSGIAGNELHASSACFGQSGLERIDRDAIDQPGVKYVIVDEGANDITQPRETSADELYSCLPHKVISAAGMIADYKRAIAIIHAHHLKAIGVTISPFGRYSYWTRQIEAERQQINHWIRDSHAFNSVIDFDRVLRDPQHPAWLKPAFDSGDGLHPNDAGHAAMAKAISLSIFGARH